MREKMKPILRPFTGTGAIFFPIGRPPKGSCEFASEMCLRECYADENHYPNYDIEVLINDSHWIYDMVIKKSVRWLVRRFKKELKGLQTNILHWFGSGDCERKNLDKICKLIDEVSKEKNIIQIGFTRNQRLWNKYKNIFALSIDDVSDISGRKGMFSMSNYKTTTSIMYNCNEEVTRCGALVCSDVSGNESLEHYINCKNCLRMRHGCFHYRLTKIKLDK